MGIGHTLLRGLDTKNVPLALSPSRVHVLDEWGWLKWNCNEHFLHNSSALVQTLMLCRGPAWALWVPMTLAGDDAVDYNRHPFFNVCSASRPTSPLPTPFPEQSLRRYRFYSLR
jgi:hypothetical protein